MLRGSSSQKPLRSPSRASAPTSPPHSDSRINDSVTPTNDTYNVSARRPSPLTTARQPLRARRRPYTMPSTVPESTTNTSAAVTTQNRSYENQLNNDVILV